MRAGGRAPPAAANTGMEPAAPVLMAATRNQGFIWRSRAAAPKMDSGPRIPHNTCSTPQVCGFRHRNMTTG